MHPTERLTARHDINDVLIAYCSHLDRMDLPALAALFTPDCEVSFGDDPALMAKGRDALEQSLARMWRWARTSHHLSNVMIGFDAPGAATVESYVHAWHEYLDGREATIYGRYLDRFSNGPEGWRILQRRMQMNGADAGFRVAIPQAPRAPAPPGWRPPVHLDLTTARDGSHAK